MVALKPTLPARNSLPMIATNRPSLRPLALAAAGAAIFFLVLLLLPLPAGGAALPPPPEPAASIGTTNCRVGVSLGTGDVTTQRSWIPTFRVGWFLSFSVFAGSVPSNVEFTPMVSVHQPRDLNGTYLPGYTVNFPLTPDGLGIHIANNPGALWIVGNEVERIGQGEIFADQYAIAYHDVYSFIKSEDPTAQVAPSALVQVTPNRLQYLDQLYAAYVAAFGTPMPVDAWTMHLYILPEVQPDGVTPNGIASVGLGTDPALGRRESGGDPAACSAEDVYCFAEHDNMTVFAEQVTAMRAWMRDHGYRDRPLLITEYSILYPYQVDPFGCFLQDEFGGCFTPQRISDFVVNSFAYLDTAADGALGMPADNNRLVQQWLWYSLNTELAGDESDLLNESLTGLTAVGQTFLDQVLARPLAVNLVAQAARPAVAAAGAPAPLSVTIGNNGNTSVNSSFQVAYYDDATNALIGTATIPALDGCARRTATATVNWSGLGTGIHRYRAVVDAGGAIPETSEADNVVYGTVLIDPATTLFLPRVDRDFLPAE